MRWCEKEWGDAHKEAWQTVCNDGLIVVTVTRVKTHQTVNLKGYIVLYIKLILKVEGPGSFTRAAFSLRLRVIIKIPHQQARVRDHHYSQLEAPQRDSGLCHTSDEADSERLCERNLLIRLQEEEREKRGNSVPRPQPWTRRSVRVTWTLRKCGSSWTSAVCPACTSLSLQFGWILKYPVEPFESSCCAVIVSINHGQPPKKRRDLVWAPPLTNSMCSCERTLISLQLFPIGKMGTVGSSAASFSYCETVNEVIYFEMPLKRYKVMYKCWLGMGGEYSINSSSVKKGKNCDN